MISNPRQFYRNPSFMATEIDGEYVLMCLQSGKYYFIKHAGTRIWELLEQPSSLRELIDCLQYEFDVDPELCRKDVEPFIHKLVDRGLVLAQ